MPPMEPQTKFVLFMIAGWLIGSGFVWLFIRGTMTDILERNEKRRRVEKSEPEAF
jgi:hypothetical protein